MAKVFSYLWDRAREPSTWRGITMIATMLGAPAGTIDMTVKVGLIAVGVLGTLPDPKTTGVQS